MVYPKEGRYRPFKIFRYFHDFPLLSDLCAREFDLSERAAYLIENSSPAVVGIIILPPAIAGVAVMSPPSSSVHFGLPVASSSAKNLPPFAPTYIVPSWYAAEENTEPPASKLQSFAAAAGVERRHLARYVAEDDAPVCDERRGFYLRLRVIAPYHGFVLDARAVELSVLAREIEQPVRCGGGRCYRAPTIARHFCLPVSQSIA